MVFDFDNFDPKRLVGIINQYGVTSFCAPPTVYRYLVKKGIPPMPTLRHAATAGEQLHPEIFRRFTQSTGLPLMEGYGQTETTLLLANLQGWEPLEGSMGVPSPLYRIQLQNPDGTPTPVGEIGEVVICPPRRASRWACSPSTWGTRRSTPRPGEAASTTQGTRPGRMRRGTTGSTAGLMTSSRQAGSGWAPLRWKTFSWNTRRCWSAVWWGFPIPPGPGHKAVVVPVPEREPSRPGAGDSDVLQQQAGGVQVGPHR